MILRDAGFAEDSVARLAKAHGRLLGAGDDEIQAASAAARAALGHPLMDRARGAKRAFRELPVTLKLEGGRLVEGSIDLAFLEHGVWRIVDFKTDAHVSGNRTRYERQLRWYRAAIEKATGQRAECYLLSL